MPNDAKLYELADAMKALMEEVEAQGGEITEEQIAWMNSLDWTIDEKVDAICKVRREKLDHAAANRAEAKRQTDKAVVRENAAERLKSYLFKSLETAQKDRVETTLNTVRIQANSQPKVRWNGEPGLVPPEFRRVIPEMVELDKKAVIQAWRDKKPLPGGIEVEQGKHIVIQ